LNGFLPAQHRKQSYAVACARDATVKHQIEALGVPHTEVELILVNGVSVGFDHLLRDGDRVAVYPKFEALDITPLLRVREWPLRRVRFVADAHLGGLARLLRLAGFDTLYDNRFHDDEVERLAVEEERIVLSKDMELLKRRAITHGCFVRAWGPGSSCGRSWRAWTCPASPALWSVPGMQRAPARRGQGPGPGEAAAGREVLP